MAIWWRCVAGWGGADFGRLKLGKYHDLVNMTKKYKGDAHEFFMDLTSWRQFKSPHKLDWKRVPFKPESRELVPKEPGIYVFTTELLNSALPPHGYILYVGITGDGESKSNLRVRYGQYENKLKNDDGRTAVFYMMDNWRDDLVFNYVPIPDDGIDLGQIEADFINAVMPPVNKRDFETTKAAVRQSAF